MLLNNFTGTISNGITSIDETEANGEYSFKIYSLPSMLGATLFNKVRIFRSDATTVGGYNLEIAEFQIWINGTNIAPNITPIASFVRSTSGAFRLEIINDTGTQRADQSSSVYIATDATSQGLFGNGTYNLTDNPIEVIFSMGEKNINDLQSIVVYGRNHSGTYYNLQGASVQLLYNDNVIYTQEINNKNGTSNQLVWRFDGPDISNVSTFADSASAEYIIGSNYDKLYTYTIT